MSDYPGPAEIGSAGVSLMRYLALGLTLAGVVLLVLSLRGC